MSNSLGALGIDLFANTATFESDMGRAARVAERESASMAAAAARAGTMIGAGLMAAAGAAVFFTQKSIAMRASLDDLADVTGDSVESLDGMRRTAYVAGVEFGKLEQIILRTSKGLETQKGQSAVAAIGLDFEKLQAMKPADSMMEIARALAEYEDGQRKMNVATALWGKDGARQLALMKDLAEAGVQQGRITAEMAAQAEKAEKEWRKLVLVFSDAKEGIVTAMVPSIANMIEQMNEGIRIAGGFWNALKLFGTINPFKDLETNIAASMARLESLRNPGMISMGKSGAKVRGTVDTEAIAEEERRLAFLQLQRRQQMAASGGDASSPLFEFGGGGIRKTPGDVGGDGKKAKDNAAEQARALQAVNDILDEANRLGVQFLQNQEKTLERERERLGVLAQRSEVEYLLAQHAALEARDDQIRANALKNRKDETKELEDAARQLGLTFSSAFEAAVTGGKELSDVVKGLISDLVQLGVRKMVTEPLADAGSKFFKGLITSGIGAMFGGSSTVPMDVPAYASGTDYVPRDMLAMVHKGEAIIPANQNRGGGGISIVQNIHVDSRSDMASIYAAMERSKQEAVAEVARECMRGGNYAAAVRGG